MQAVLKTRPELVRNFCPMRSDGSDNCTMTASLAPAGGAASRDRYLNLLSIFLLIHPKFVPIMRRGDGAPCSVTNPAGAIGELLQLKDASGPAYLR